MWCFKKRLLRFKKIEISLFLLSNLRMGYLHIFTSISNFMAVILLTMCGCASKDGKWKAIVLKSKSLKKGTKMSHQKTLKI